MKPANTKQFAGNTNRVFTSIVLDCQLRNPLLLTPDFFVAIFINLLSCLLRKCELTK